MPEEATIIETPNAAELSQAPQQGELSRQALESHLTKSAFRDALEKNGIKLGNDGGIPMNPNDGRVVERPPETIVPKQESAPNGTHPTPDPSDDFPSELIEGAKEAATVEDPDAVFKEAPKGPVKHEHFERVQKTALEKVQAARAEAETLKAEIAKLKTGTPQLSEEHVKTIEALKAEREQLLEKLGVADYASTPEFVSKFTAKEEQIKNSLLETVEDKDLIAALIHVPVKRRMAMMDEAELSPSVRGRLDALLVRHDEVQADKAVELANWRTNAANRQQAQAAQEQARAAAEEKEYDAALAEVSKELFESEPFRIIPGQDKWNAVAEKNRANALELIKGNLSPKAIVRGAIHAAGYETLLGMFRKVQTEAKTMRGELQKLRGNTPTPNNSAPNNTGVQDISKMNDSEAARANWHKYVGRNG